jgi:septal ring factor EnvC (AmiA/AmiB activator)
MTEEMNHKEKVSDMSMSKADVLIEAIQSKVTDEQATSWVAELGDILDERDKQIVEWQSDSVNVRGAMKAKDKQITELEKALAICESEYRKTDKQIAELVAALQQSAIRDRALGDSHHAFNIERLSARVHKGD